MFMSGLSLGVLSWDLAMVLYADYSKIAVVRLDGPCWIAAANPVPVELRNFKIQNLQLIRAIY
jgi:hypothetical protein